MFSIIFPFILFIATMFSSTKCNPKEVPLPELVPLNGDECHVKIGGKLAKLYKFEDGIKKQKWRYLFYLDGKMHILHAKAGNEFLERQKNKKSKCQTVADVELVYPKIGLLDIYFLNINYIKLGRTNLGCKAFGPRGQLITVFKCPLAKMEESEEEEIEEEDPKMVRQDHFGCNKQQLFIPMGKKIYAIYFNIPKKEEAQNKRTTFLGGERVPCSYFATYEDFEPVQFYGAKNGGAIGRIKTALKRHGIGAATMAVGFGCAIGYTVCKIMNN